MWCAGGGEGSQRSGGRAGHPCEGSQEAAAAPGLVEYTHQRSQCMPRRYHFTISLRPVASIHILLQHLSAQDYPDERDCGTLFCVIARALHDTMFVSQVDVEQIAGMYYKESYLYTCDYVRLWVGLLCKNLKLVAGWQSNHLNQDSSL